MAIVQISRIQHRRGLDQDLPQLASAELGWSIDQRKLYIGNGTIEEGAPSEGVTEILTERTDFLGLISSYTFKGTESGYTSLTGPSATSPFNRSLQYKLDESVSVKDFGAVGNGTVDDTVAIDRAIRQIYISSLSSILPSVRRVINFPAGVYKITSNLVIPPNCTLIGAGKNNTIISSNVAVFQTCDSQFEISSGMTLTGGVLPGNITIRDMGLSTSSTSIPAAFVNRATHVILDNINFTGGTYGLAIVQSANVEVSSSTFSGSTQGSIDITGNEDGLLSRSNYFDTIRKTLTVGNNNITTLANGAGRVDYEITSGTNYRIGTMKYNRSNGTCRFDDEFSEPSSGIDANLYVAETGAVTCTVSSGAILKYNIKQFI